MSQKGFFILNGLPGSGKSHLARYLARECSAVHLSTDEQRHHFLQAETSEELKYHPAVTRMIFSLLNLHAEIALMNKQSVILDAVNNYPPAWPQYIALAERLGAICIFVDIFESDDVVLQGLKQNQDRYFSEADVQTYQKFKSSEFPYAGDSEEVKKSATVITLNKSAQTVRFAGVQHANQSFYESLFSGYCRDY